MLLTNYFYIVKHTLNPTVDGRMQGDSPTVPKVLRCAGLPFTEKAE